MEKSVYFIEKFPCEIRLELSRICATGRGEISEIRLRAHGRSSLLIGGERVGLSCSPTERELAKIVASLCDGAVYAHRESFENGYVSLKGGVRVGICGQAGYDGGALVGVGRISSLVFRIPSGKSEVAEELLDAFSNALHGMLIYSSPGVGKTTALRSLISGIGSSQRSLEVVVVDERGEFLAEDYSGCSVDVLRGYKRALGIEIALRTLSPDVIVIDEIGAREEADAILDLLNCGVRVIASAHSDSYETLIKKRNLRAFLENDVFDVFAGISLSCGHRRADIRRWRC